MMKIKTLQHDDFIKYKSVIKKQLESIYYLNFDITEEYCKQMCEEKISQLSEFIINDKAHLIGAFDNFKLVGFAWVYIHQYFEEKRLHLNQIMIEDGYKGKGIGKLLMHEIEIMANTLNIHTIDLFVTEKNIAAIGLYEKLGYETERRYLKKSLKEDVGCLK